MSKRFKKIYVEITNKCNLNCSFCSKTKRKLREMKVEEFSLVIEKIKSYTDFIYLHIKGEPLLHSNFDSILSICDENNIKVNITTNGTLLSKNFENLNNHSCIRQINVSLHSENNINNYFDDVFECCKKLSTKMFISYRLWTLKNYSLDKKSTEIVKKIINSYNLSTKDVEKLKDEKSFKIDINTFVNKDNLFDWPNSSLGLNIDGKCYGLDTHIGILSDGTVVPCCLDSEGELSLGNIFKDSLDDILNCELAKKIIQGFKENKSSCLLCKNCNFRFRFVNKEDYEKIIS